MQPVTVIADSTATPTYSPWVRMSHYSYDFNVGFTCTPEKSTTGTYTVQTTLSNPEKFRPALYGRVGTTLTVTCIGTDTHGLSVGDAVNIQGTPWDNTTTSLAVASVSSTTVFTITVANSGPTSGGLLYAPLPVQALASFSAVSGTQQGTIVGATEMVRIAKASGDTLNGRVDLTVVQAGF